MTARISDATARRLGITPAKPKRTTQRVARGPYHTICVLCRTEFSTQAAEDRHLNETSHPRYALVINEREQQ